MRRKSNNASRGMPTVRSDFKERMATYDDLPPVVRKALQEAPYNSSTGELPSAVAAYGAEQTAAMLTAHLSKAFRDQFRAEIGEAYD